MSLETIFRDTKGYYDKRSGIIGELIRKERQKNYSNINAVAQAFYNSGNDFNEERILAEKISLIERGCLYFGLTSDAAKRIRGKENLDKLAIYISFLGIPEEHEIVKLLKEFDFRFEYRNG